MHDHASVQTALRRIVVRAELSSGNGRPDIEAAIYFLFRRRTFFLAAAPVVMLVVARPSREGVLFGLPFVVAGEGIRVWSAGYLTKLSKLVTAGPYALCRNPMYVGMFLISIGYLAMCGRLEVWIGGIALFWLFHGGAVAYEERLLRGKFAEQYAEYSRRVPRLVPRLRAVKGEGTFSWRRLVMNNEHLALGAAVIMCAIFAANAYSTQRSPLEWLASIRP